MISKLEIKLKQYLGFGATVTVQQLLLITILNQHTVMQLRIMTILQISEGKIAFSYQKKDLAFSFYQWKRIKHNGNILNKK